MSKIKKYLDNKGLTTLIGMLKKYFGRVKTVDGENPDENGNVQLSWIGTKAEWEALDKSQFTDKGAIRVYFTDVVKYEPVTMTAVYSTEEKIVGTWIDGKPIYRKVVTGVDWHNSNWNKDIFNKLDVSIVDKFIYVTGIASSIVCASMLLSKELGLRSYVSAETNATVIIEYTKTTDSPTV